MYFKPYLTHPGYEQVTDNMKHQLIVLSKLTILYRNKHVPVDEDSVIHIPDVLHNELHKQWLLPFCMSTLQYLLCFHVEVVVTPQCFHQNLS